jgi:hypothetical protein
MAAYVFSFTIKNCVEVIKHINTYDLKQFCSFKKNKLGMAVRKHLHCTQYIIISFCVSEFEVVVPSTPADNDFFGAHALYAEVKL